jgi:hypothetical protein
MYWSDRCYESSASSWSAYRAGMLCLGWPYLIGTYKEVITKTISQQEQIGRSPI